VALVEERLLMLLDEEQAVKNKPLKRRMTITGVFILLRFDVK
jgi:hypothetical protein